MGGGGSLFGAGSAGSGGLQFGAPPAGMAAAADDPYNIPIDLTAIKRPAKPDKPFEMQTSEEKMVTMQQIQQDSQKTGAKSIMKQPGAKKSNKKASISFGQCLIYEYDKDTVAVAKKVDTKDISDMRDEKTKMKALLQEKENEQLA